jgi:hypothetical protein
MALKRIIAFADKYGNNSFEFTKEGVSSHFIVASVIIYRTFPQLELKVDEHGSNDFMRSFKKYVSDNHIRTLFSWSDFIIEKRLTLVYKTKSRH